MPDPDPTEELKQKEARLKAEAGVVKAEADLAKARSDAAAAARAADPGAVSEAEQKAREEARLKADAGIAKAQAELTKAKADAAAAAKPPDPAVIASTADKARLDAQKAALDAAKGVSDAKKAADLAAAQAAIGTVTGSGIEGTVTVKTDAGKAEAALLAARGAIDAAERLVTTISGKVKGKDVVVMQGAEGAQFSAYRQFLLQQGVLQQAFGYAHKEADRLRQEAQNLENAVLEAAPLLTTAGVALDAAAKLGSYFLSNYEIGGIGLTPDTDQLAAAVIDQLLQCGATVELPARRVPQPKDFESLVKTLTDLTSASETKAAAMSSDAQRTSNAAKKSATDKENLQGAATQYEQAAALLRKAISKAEELIAGLNVADSKGVLLITKIAQEKALWDALSRAGVLALYLDVRAAAGSYYTKKNLWTFLGGMPFYVMGGLVVTYHLVDQAGAVSAAGLVPVHSGYSKVSEVGRLVNATARAARSPTP